MRQWEIISKTNHKKKSKKLWTSLGSWLRQASWDQVHPTQKEKWLIPQALDDTDGKTKGLNDFFKNTSPTSQFWNSRGPQMPFLLVILSICHICSYNQNFTCIYQSAPLWTKWHKYVFTNNLFNNIYPGIQPAIFPFELAVQFFQVHIDEFNDESRTTHSSTARRQKHGEGFLERLRLANSTIPGWPRALHSSSKPRCRGPSRLSTQGW